MEMNMSSKTPAKPDYYTYWNSASPSPRVLRHREKVVLRMLGAMPETGLDILDIGCGTGFFLNVLQAKKPIWRLQGVDLSADSVRIAREQGLAVTEGDGEGRLPFPDGTFDVVYAGEVIEHVFSPDDFLDEVARVLRPGGRFVLSTPNLCAWFNRVLMVLGIQPLYLEPSTRSKRVGAGVLARLKKEDQPVGHVRILTPSALRDLLARAGFNIERWRGAIYDEGLPPFVLAFDRLFLWPTSWAAHAVVMAQRKPGP
jgi:SAM-dependent methyltransferase